MMKPVVVVDLDDVIIDLDANMRPYFNQKYGKSFAKEEMVNFYGYTEMYGISLEQFYEDIREGQLLERAEPIEGSLQALELLSRTHDIIFITARGYHPDAYAITEDWLDEKMDEAGLVSPYDLKICGFGQSKAEAFLEFIKGNLWYSDVRHAEAMFDDNRHNLESLRSVHLVKNIYLITQPWNSQFIPEAPMYFMNRKKNFSEAVEHFLSIGNDF